MLLGTDATELVDRLRDGEVGSEELVRAPLGCLDNLDALGAVAWRDDEQVLAEARRADERRAAREPLGALHGLPVTIKDWIDVVGFPCAGESLNTSAGDRRRTQPWRPACGRRGRWSWRRPA